MSWSTTEPFVVAVSIVISVVVSIVITVVVSIVIVILSRDTFISFIACVFLFNFLLGAYLLR